MRKDLLIGSLVYFTIPLTSAISLANFQKLTVEVTNDCEAAYDEKIPGCRASDFTLDGTCSSACISGLNQIAGGVLQNCGGVVVGSSTLLGKIFNGEIIPSLCPNNGDSSGDSSSAAPSTTAAPATTAQSTTQAAPKSSKQASSSASAPSASDASSSSSAAATPASSAAPSGSSSAAAVSSASSSTSSSAAEQTSSASDTQSGDGRSGLTVQQQQIAAMSRSGGGSPFDIIGYSAAGRLSPRDVIAITLGLALLLIGWLMR